MKIAKTVFVVCTVLLIVLAEATRIGILRRLGMGFPVPEYESQMSRFLQSLSFAPVGLAIGVAALFFPQRVMDSYDKWTGKVRSADPTIEVFGLRLAGVFFISGTLVALWTTGQFLFP